MNHTTWQLTAANSQDKTIYFIRHAQAVHNLTGEHGIRDPRLTQDGVRQAQRICDGLPADVLANIQLIVTSPLKRALQTTQLAFRRQIDWQNVQVRIEPMLQATEDVPCDTGSGLHELLDEFPSLHKELHACDQIAHHPADWFQKTDIYEASVQAIRDRAERMRRWLLARPEKVIVIVAHDMFLKYLIGDELVMSTGGAFKNGECRRYLLHAESASMSTRGVQVLQMNTVDAEIERVGYLD